MLKFLRRTRRPFCGLTVVGAVIAASVVVSGMLLVPQVATAANNSEAISAVNGMTDPLFAAGFAHTCAVLNTGDVTCWGINNFGQLGNSTNSGTHTANPAPLPVVLPAGTTATALTAGDDHTCAVLNTGDVTCWGYNVFGQLGNDTNSGTRSANPAPLPVVLPAGTTATALTAGGAHTCAVLNTGAVTCWGNNYFGQLGNSTDNGQANPTPTLVGLPAGTTVTALTVGGLHTCAVLNTGDVTCWGYNWSGQLGNTTNNYTHTANPTPTPVALPAGTTATALTAGDAHTCAVLNTGAAYCWGNNSFGQLGKDTSNHPTTANPTPVSVRLPTGTTATALIAAHDHTCAVLNTGAAYCWGNNYSGQLGNSTDNGQANPNPTPTPVALPTATTVTALTAGFAHTCAVRNTGDVTCWGYNNFGQLGNDTNSGTVTANPAPLPVVLPTATTATALTAGDDHTCAVLNTGAVTCWGYNVFGQLGNTTNNGTSTANPAPLPVVLPTATTATALTAGDAHTCALLNTGAVTCWGHNRYGQLGNSTNNGTSTANPAPLPVVLPAGTTATALAAGDDHTCAVLNTGDVTCWGRNLYGQLGNSTNNRTSNTNPAPLPVVLPAGTTATALTAGDAHTCAVLNTGDVTCWGYNYSGQLGNTTNTDTSNTNPTPLPVALPAGTTATALTAGFAHTCAVLNTGDVTCWGRNYSGQLGNDTNTLRVTANPAPLPVVLPTATTATALTAGDSHTCAVLNTGAVTCWGSNRYGHLGNTTNSGTVTANPTPLPVVPWTVPGSPTRVNVAGLSDFAVSWHAPATDGGSAVTGYTVTSDPDAKTCTTTGALSCTVTGLTNGTGYTFTVTAANVAGSSSVSNPSAAVYPRTVPGSPTTVTATAGNAAATAIWVAPTSNGGSTIEGYTVTSDPDAKTCTTTGALTCTVTGLTNGTGYTFTVTATNVVGSSSVSAASVAVVALASTVKSVSPGRVLESRSGNPEYITVDGLFQGTGRTAAGQIAEIKVTDRAGVPADAEAVFLNVVAVSPSGPGYLTVFPCGITPPVAANVNYNTGDVAANAVLAKIGVGGKVCVFTAAATDLVIDVNGFTPAGAGTKSVSPGRVLESRSGNPEYITVDGLFQGTGRTAAGQIAEIKVTDRAGVPADAEAVFLNVVAVSPSGPGYLTVFPCGITPPVAANVNYNTGDVAANAVLAKIGVGGKVCVFTAAATDLVIDVNGFTPAGAT
jgi:alpha-tubulin suppressor-like RCC1 family protein